jgi:hypothetical protein
MKRTHFAVALATMGWLALPGAGCTGGPTTSVDTGAARGAFTGSGWACTCPNDGATCVLSCPDGTDGSCSNGQPYCDVTVIDSGTGLACACPKGGASCAITCPNGSGGSCSNGQPACGSGSVDAGTASSLKWYVTCGAPVCGGPNQSCSPDSSACAAVGSACSTKGQTCNDCKQGCGARIVCDDHDPTANPGGCPISSRKFKDNIAYLGPNELDRLRAEAMRMKLATYNYKNPYGNPEETHLGFIIEDNPQSLAVDRGHDRVDIYGYLSMILATTQVQEKEIQELRRQVAACSKP